MNIEMQSPFTPSIKLYALVTPATQIIETIVIIIGSFNGRTTSEAEIKCNASLGNGESEHMSST